MPDTSQPVWCALHQEGAATGTADEVLILHIEKLDLIAEAAGSSERQAAPPQALLKE
jgi:hypothetical protein